jgi:hypothetical protein
MWRRVQFALICFKLVPGILDPGPLSKVALNLSMKCWNLAFIAQGSRVIIVVVQVGAVKMFVAAVEAFRKKERGDGIQFITKIGGKTNLGPSYLVL